jgi:ABC-2 type transport system permease protein
MIRDYWTGMKFQVVFMRRNPGSFTVLLATPFLTLAFGEIIQHAGRNDLAPYTVLGPAIMAMWGMALVTSGDVIDSDRGNGILEIIMAVPARLQRVITGRILMVTLMSLISVPESMLVAYISFGITVKVYHLDVLVAATAITSIAMAGTATIFSSLFVLARSARTLQNSLSYPFYLLSGAVVPVALLPGWLQPLCRVVFLSWSSDLARASLGPNPVSDLIGRFIVILGLGLAGYCIALMLLWIVIRRSRSAGTIGYQ